MLHSGQSLLQTGADISKWGNFITKWGRYCKNGQPLLQSRAASGYHKVGQGYYILQKWVSYYKAGQYIDQTFI